jgi:hypothetical protein
MTKTKTTKKAMTMIADDEMTTMTATAAASTGARVGDEDSNHRVRWWLGRKKNLTKFLAEFVQSNSSSHRCSRNHKKMTLP